MLTLAFRVPSCKSCKKAGHPGWDAFGHPGWDAFLGCKEPGGSFTGALAQAGGTSWVFGGLLEAVRGLLEAIYIRSLRDSATEPKALLASVRLLLPDTGAMSGPALYEYCSDDDPVEILRSKAQLGAFAQLWSPLACELGIYVAYLDLSRVTELADKPSLHLNLGVCQFQLPIWQRMHHTCSCLCMHEFSESSGSKVEGIASNGNLRRRSLEFCRASSRTVPGEHGLRL